MNDLRRHIHPCLCLVGILLLATASGLIAQDVDAGVEPWRLVRIFIEQTGSPLDDVDRARFATRLGGRLAGLDPVSVKGHWGRYVDVKIDTVVRLDPLLRPISADPQRKLPGRTDTLERVAVWATSFKGGNYDNSYFFLERDSIWRIVEWIEFPTTAERAAIVREADRLDTTREDYIVRRRTILSLLHHDILHRSRFPEIAGDLDRLARQLSRITGWQRIELGAIPVDSLDPFAALDLPEGSRTAFLHRLNPAGLDRLFTGGIARILRHGAEIRFEIGRFGGRSVGYLWRPPDTEEVRPDPEGDFLLSPLGGRWWFYRSFHTPEQPAAELIRLPEDLLGSRPPVSLILPFVVALPRSCGPSPGPLQIFDHTPITG